MIPGFIDTHRHTWETSIRTCAPDYALITYFGSILDKFAPHYRPDDVLRGEPVGRARVHQRGHHDARRLVAHHEHAGPRRRGDPGASRTRASGRCSPTASATRRSRTGGSGRTTRAASLTSTATDARRLRKQYFSSDDGLITMAPRDARHRTSASPTSSATTGSWPRSSASTSRSTWRWTGSATRRCQLTRLRDMDLLYPNTTYVHALAPHRRGVGAGPRLGRQRLVRAADRGPDGPRLGARGQRAATTACRSGCRSDVATTAPSDQFTQMRSIFGSERGRKHQEAWDANLDGLEASPGPHHLAPGARVGDARRRQGRGHRRPDRLDHARQEGRHRDHRRVARSTSRRSSTRWARWSARPTSRTSRRSSSTASSLKEDFKLAASLGEPRKAVEASRDYLARQVRRPGARLAAREGRHRLTVVVRDLARSPGRPRRPGFAISRPGSPRSRTTAARGRAPRDGRPGGRPTSRPGAR